jgi:predicted ATPase
MKISINCNELIQILTLTPTNQNIMLVGQHGIGKSEIIKQFYKEKEMKVISFFLGQMSDPGDLIGLMHKNEQTGTSTFLPPYWWPVDNKPVVLFLDELNRARPEILQSIMDLTLNKSLAGKILPSDSIIISAINDGDEYQITDLDPALVSRFNIYHFRPTVNEWLLWATKNHFDNRVLTFISNNHSFLDTNPEDTDNESSLTKTPDRRAWHRVSDFLKTNIKVEEVAIKVISGIVGIRATIAFKESLNTLKINPKELLFEFNKIKTKLSTLELTAFSKLNTEICCFMESEIEIWNHKETLIQNIENYLKWLKKNKHNEVIAHFISEIENPNYINISRLVFVESAYSSQFITSFIENIK